MGKIKLSESLVRCIEPKLCSKNADVDARIELDAWLDVNRIYVKIYKLFFMIENGLARPEG